MKVFSVFAAALLFAAGYAEEPPPSDFAKAQSELKARAPEDFARIEKLAATDLYAAMREFRAAAKKHDIKLPRPNFQRNRRPADSERPGRGDRPWRGERPGRGGSPLELLAADAAIRKAFPQEFDAVNGELAAAEAKMSDLAKRAGVEYPVSPAARMRRLRAAAPEKMAEIERLASDNPREAFRALAELAQEHGLGFGAPGGRGRRGFDRERGDDAKPEPRRLAHPPLRKLREAFPEEMKRYQELRRDDPAAAKKLLRELTERLDRENRQGGDAR